MDIRKLPEKLPGYENIKKLLEDNAYVTELLNRVCRPGDGQNVSPPLNGEWIDSERSGMLTEQYRMLSAQDGTFINVVKVLHRPDLPVTTVAVGENEARSRYVLITVIPDIPPAYELNFSLIQSMSIMALMSWEISRASTEASHAMANILITKNPVPPILNNAMVDWVSIYVGRKIFEGADNLMGKYAVSSEENLPLDMHLYQVRQMDPDPLLERLLQAYEKDIPDISAESDDNDNDELE